MSPNKKLPLQKKGRNVLNVADKIKIINLLENGKKVMAVARKLGINESSVRTIRPNKDKIRAAAALLGPYAKMTKITRNLNIIKMEEMLMVWIQDLIHKRIAVGTCAIKDQALEFFNYLEKKIHLITDFFSK